MLSIQILSNYISTCLTKGSTDFLTVFSLNPLLPAQLRPSYSTKFNLISQKINGITFAY